VQPIHITFLNGPDIERIALTDTEILAAVERGLLAQGQKQVVIEPRVHLVPRDSAEGHFNVLRGAVLPLGLAGVKVVGDFVNNYKVGLPSELAVLNLFDPDTGVPKAILDATSLTDMRTGAMTALGGKLLARKDSKVLGHVGARGTSYWNVRLLSHYFEFDEIRVHSRRPESRAAFAKKLTEDLGRPVVAVDRLGGLRAGRGYRRGGLTSPRAAAASENRVDQTGRARRPVWNHERGGVVADRHHEQGGRR
jgi:alanine dehydrogenase